MQPNSPTNPQPNPASSPTPALEPNPVASAPVATPANGVPAQSTQPTPTPPNLIDETKKLIDKIPSSTKNSFRQKHIWIIAALSVTTILAIIFGVAQTVQNTRTHEEIEALSAELDEKAQLVTKYAAALGLNVSQSNNPNLRPAVKPDDSTEEDDKKDDQSTGNYIASPDYIYIGEWGIKVKVPEGLKNISYRFNNIQFAATEETEAFVIESLCVSGILDTMTFTPEAFRIDNQAGLGCLSRTTNAAHADSPDIVKELDGYYYEYAHPQAILSVDEQEQKQEAEVTKLIEQMLTNSDNLTKF